MPKFDAGDVVQVDYKSTRLIEEWMQGLRLIGPGDVGVVKYSAIEDETRSYIVTVSFPMLGTVGIHSRDLKILQKVADGT